MAEKITIEHDEFVVDQAGDAHHFGPLPTTKSRALLPEQLLLQQMEGHVPEQRQEREPAVRLIGDTAIKNVSAA